MEIFIRKFNSKELVYTDQSDHTISPFFPKALREAFVVLLAREDIKITEEDYIICPMYTEGDYQIGVTGSVQKDEKNIDAICREMGEEIGCIPVHESLLKEIGSYENNKKKTVVYTAYLGQCISVPGHLDNVDVSKSTDNRKKKVGCFVYGSKKNVVSFMLSKKINRYFSTDTIVGIVAINVRHIIDHFYDS